MMVVSTSGSEKNGVILRRFSSLEPRTPTSPNGNDHHNTYTAPDLDDNVFTDDKEVPPKFDVPPTPGTAPSHGNGWSKRPLALRDAILIALGVFLIAALAVGIAVAVILINKESSSSSSLSSQQSLSTAETTPESSSQATSASPATASPTSASPATASPTTESPTTASPTSSSPTTGSPTTAPPTTALPTTASPTTASPTKASSTTGSPTTGSPTTGSPTTASPTTGSPTTDAPTSASPTTDAPTSASPTTDASTSASPTTASVSPTEEIHYDGHLNLSAPWQTSMVELGHIFQQDMTAIIAATPLYKSFIKSSLLTVSANDTLIFSLDFKKRSLLEAVNTTEEVTDNSLARTVQTILRNQVVTNTGIKLQIKADTIVILAENIPATATTGTPTTSVSTTTEEPCRSMTFEPCHSLLGSSTFYLPNILHHKTALQAEDAFLELSGPAVNTSCSSVSLFYLCALLFPSCDDISNFPLYPCDTICEVVKNDCGILDGWPQNCSDLPKEKCKVQEPEAPATSQTMLTSTASTIVASTTSAELETTSTEPIVTPIQQRVQCVPFNFSLCNALGLNETALPSYKFQCHDVQCLIEKFNEFSEESIANNCTSDLNFFCAYTFRGCNKDNLLDPIGPCFESCVDAVDHCGNFMPDQPDCYEFNRTHVPCFPPEPASVPTTESPYTETCVNQTYSYCATEGLTRTSANMLEEEIVDFEKWALPTIESGCSEVAKFFYCGVYLPLCYSDGTSKLPCRRYCEDVHAKCPNVKFPIECSDFDDDDALCLSPQTTTTMSTTSTSTTTAIPTTTTTTTTLAPHCEPLKPSICSQFGYSQTSFPNLWADRSAEEANKTYYRVAERSVAAGCSPNILFYICSALFPSCQGDGLLKLPCTTYCKEVNANCPLLFEQNCDVLSDPSPDTCLAPPVRTACSTDEFTCVNIIKCVPQSAVCNHKNDCGDWSDERNCECNHEFEIQCAMGLCIPSYYRCDDTAQCPDNSDEVGCECKMNQYKCGGKDGPCIMPEWICDGQSDCPDSDDEMYCRNCDVDEYMCVDNTCIPSSQECDGTPQCPDHTDEMDCIYKFGPTSAFFIKHSSEAVMVCSEGFTDVHGDTTCLKMGDLSLKKWTPVKSMNLLWYFQLDPAGDQLSVIGKGKSVKNCPKDFVVAVECNPKECGHPSENLPSLIINGKDALIGSWPWMVSLQKYHIHQCGGSIVHPYFILTAGHCVDSSTDYSLMRIVAGTSRLSQLGSQSQQKKIRRAIRYPGYKLLAGDDIALLELEEPLKYNDFIKPICFPEKADVFTRANPCYIAGWGHTKGVQGEISDNQKETKLTLWDTQKCNSSYMWDGRLLPNEMCAGYFNGLVAACSGDSGSPVTCQDVTKTWKAVGLASYVYKTCSVATKPIVFTPIMPYVEWIKNHTVCHFTCGDGICLFDKDMLCNTVADCKDRSDEIDLCDVRANCSFGERFLCGYQSRWQLVANIGPDSANRLPLFDHTIGKYPGMYLFGKTRGDDIKSPRIDLTTPHCMRFHYHMRGRVDHGMAVSVHNLERKGWVDVWSMDRTIGPDKWLMGMFDLEAGHFDIVFRPHDNRRFAVDDMWLLEGTCNKTSCFEDEFQCVTFGTMNCLPLAVRCNIVVDCDNAEDEFDCTAPAYTCDFENGNICGLEQHSDDSGMGEWAVVNSTGAPGNLQDHTFGNDSGTLLKIKTEVLLLSDKVFMSQELQLDDTEHCLRFYYASTSPVTLQVTLAWDDSVLTLIKFTDRKTDGWILTQATLPAPGQDVFATLTYMVNGGDLGPWTVEQAIMLDDISITRGQCSAFSCPPGSLLCEGEAYCVPKSKVCDLIVDCNSGTDEITCECSAKEFKCPTGPCIPNEQTCDLIKNCPDGSDEQAVCDYKRSINCNFEDPFLCGYTVNTSLTVFHWQQADGKTGNKQTGPSSDHTFEADGSLMGAYVVAESQYEGEFTSLDSFPFTSHGKGLAFYYHARHFLASAFMTGRLTLVIKFMNNGTRTEVWSDVPDNVDRWKFKCLELPLGQISISFVVQRGSYYKAYIALDDIQLLSTSCDHYLTRSRIIGGHPPTPTPQTSTGCPGTQRACTSGMCIDANLFCDKVNDCVDNSDEQNCRHDG